ncbi:MAG: hypothetical protein ACREJD_01220 [Phycisphaerales bacterium]
MNTAFESESGLRRKVIFWKGTAIAAVAGGLAIGVAGLQSEPAKKVVGVSGGDSYIYRVYEDGSIDFIQADNQIKSPRGIPNWQQIPIDRGLVRQQR